MGTRKMQVPQGALWMLTPPLNDLPANESGGATDSVQGGNRAGWVLQLNTATKVRHVEEGRGHEGGAACRSQS